MLTCLNFALMRLAVILSHPIQYNSPWFQFLVANGFAGLRVFYLWDGGATEKLDHGFGVKVKWDLPLLEGYDYEFVPNVSAKPGTHHRRGLNNPALGSRLLAFGPEAVLVFGYNYTTHYRYSLFQRPRQVPLIFRGDSHRLGRRTEDRGLRSRITSFSEWLRRRWLTWIYRRFDACLYVGQANKEYFQRHGVPEQKLFFSPHAVDNERFALSPEEIRSQRSEARKQLGIAPDRKVILFAGKFEEKKRPRDLIAAFKQAQLPDATLLLVGNGAQESVLRQDALGRHDIAFAPFQNQTQMPRTYAAGDVFVLPSHGSEETWGLAVNEAMCLRRPIIVSDHVGCAQDLVKSGRNGLIFPAGNVAALADVLREALADADRLKAWGRASREIIQDYDYAHATAGLRKALENLKAET